MFVALDYWEDILLRKASFYKLRVFTLWFLTALCLLAPVRPAAALNILPYTITDMGFTIQLGNGPVINNNTQVAGNNTNGQALLWENGNITVIGTLPGHRESFPTGISDTGQIAGLSFGLIPARAFLWENGVMMDLGTLPGYTTSQAGGINNFGQVVGRSRGGSPIEQAFIWENGVMTGLGTLGGSESEATAINDLGQVVGHSLTASGGANRNPFLWENGNMIDLGVILGTAIPTDINNAGLVVGGGSTGGFLLDNGIIVDLGGISPDAINNNNQIVGDSTSGQAALWQDGNIFNLNNLIDDGNWSLLRASDINDTGEIVGVGINPNGVRTTFLLKPIPEPSTLLLLASGLAGLAAWRRKKAA